MTATDDLIERIRAALVGIDKDENESPDGWWETSTGAHFGASKLAQVEGVIRAALAAEPNVKPIEIVRTNATEIMDAYAAQPEPPAAVLDHATYILSEWLNDGAPIGERRYREPARALLKFASLAAALRGQS